MRKYVAYTLYNTDEQIAIILNKTTGCSQSDKDAYKRMQDWRSYFGTIAKRINEIHNAEVKA